MTRVRMHETPKCLFTRPKLLLHPGLPRPLHGMAPRTILGEAWWTAERDAAFEHNNFCCWACGVHRTDAVEFQWLEGHEAYEINTRRGLVTFIEAVGLCHYCHSFIHRGRLRALVKAEREPYDKLRQVLLHGLAVLEKSKVLRKQKGVTLERRLEQLRLDDRDVPWDRWRMCVGDIYYAPVIKSYGEWLQKYQRKEVEDA